MELTTREKRRMLGYWSARLPELGLYRVPDPRQARGRRWALGGMLGATVAGMTSGAKTLRGLETATGTWSPAVRRRLGVRRRLPDTTLRSVMARIDPNDLRAVLHRQTRAAHRRKALGVDGVPCGIVSIDGKVTAIPEWSGPYAQRQVQEGRACGLVRTMTCALVSNRACPVIDAVPIPAETNEVGHFKAVVDELHAAYGGSKLFTMVAGDCGQTSLANATHVNELGYEYLLQLGDNQPTLAAEARRLSRRRDTEYETAESTTKEGGLVVSRRIWVTDAMAGYLDWTHLGVVVRVQRTVTAPDGSTTEGVRTFLTNVPRGRYTAAQWLAIVVRRWGVENQCHGILDRVFSEDERPWMDEPTGFLNLALLRRVALNLVALFRSVTLRAEHRRELPWALLMVWWSSAAVSATEALLSDLRARSEVDHTLA